MAEPITIAIATAIGLGLGKVSSTLVEKGVVEPALEPTTNRIADYVTRGYDRVKEDKDLQVAVAKALQAIGAPKDTNALNQYALNLGFDQIRASNNAQLRQEIAEATLLMIDPDPQLLPDTAFFQRWPHDYRHLLAKFLYQLRQELRTHTTFGNLIKHMDAEASRVYLRRSTTSLKNIETYLHLLLQNYELSPDVEDGRMLEEYINHVAERYRNISFLFVKPSGNRHELTIEAELETIFVPLQVYDSTDLPKEGHREEPLSSAKPKHGGGLLTIGEVLTKYPVFLLKGPPGSGKTTLLRHLAMTIARGEAGKKLGWQGEALLPILIPLRNFGRFLHDHRPQYTNPLPQALRHFIEDYFKEHEIELPVDFFRQRLKKGHCLILLDGLDEVADRDLRAEVVQVVASFIRYYEKRGNRFGLASRPKGYEEVAKFLPRPVVCDVQPLSPSNRDQLVANLLREFQQSEHRTKSELQDLLLEIRYKQRVDELSRNPLFCTTLVLVYKYRGATLPERRVDVYQELVNLMLGFWDTHRASREDVADVRQLILMDGTNRTFMDEDEAVEAKQRVLIFLADLMQQEETTVICKKIAISQLASYFAYREGASEVQKEQWARGFLNIAHQRSGLFVEVDPNTYGFSHENFREYLAATSLVQRTDKQMIEVVLDRASDAWWEEVILLAVAHRELSPARRELLLAALLEHDHSVLAGRCAVDAGARLPIPMRQQIQQALYVTMVNDASLPKARYIAGEVLDETGWLPPDLNTWMLCPGCADNRGDLWAAKYPVTNAQFALFIAAGGYENPDYWGGDDSTAWHWRTKAHPDSRGSTTIREPKYWRDMRFGKERRGYPVVGISLHEANAYANWLTSLLRWIRNGENFLTPEFRLIKELIPTGAYVICLPTKTEWTRIAGGGKNKRYAWDKKTHSVTKSIEEIVVRANVEESDIDRISPVAMFPQGISDPYGLMDMTGNVAEWTSSRSGSMLGSIQEYELWGKWAVRGGSWNYSGKNNYVSGERYAYPDFAGYGLGFRIVSIVTPQK